MNEQESNDNTAKEETAEFQISGASSPISFASAESIVDELLNSDAPVFIPESDSPELEILQGIPKLDGLVGNTVIDELPSNEIHSDIKLEMESKLSNASIQIENGDNLLDPIKVEENASNDTKNANSDTVVDLEASNINDSVSKQDAEVGKVPVHADNIEDVKDDLILAINTDNADNEVEKGQIAAEAQINELDKTTANNSIVSDTVFQNTPTIAISTLEIETVKDQKVAKAQINEFVASNSASKNTPIIEISNSSPVESDTNFHSPGVIESANTESHESVSSLKDDKDQQVLRSEEALEELAPEPLSIYSVVMDSTGDIAGKPSVVKVKELVPTNVIMDSLDKVLILQAEDLNTENSERTDESHPLNEILESTAQIDSLKTIQDIKYDTRCFSSDNSDVIADSHTFTVGKIYKVFRNHQADDLDEIELQVGDHIKIEQLEDNWALGLRVNRRECKGYFPQDCLIPSTNPETVPKGTLLKALYPYEPKKPDELKLEIDATIKVTDAPTGGWWKGTIDDKEGNFPANLVAIVEYGAFSPESFAAIDEEEELKLDFLRSSATAIAKSITRNETLKISSKDSLGKSDENNGEILVRKRSNSEPPVNSLENLNVKSENADELGESNFGTVLSVPNAKGKPATRVRSQTLTASKSRMSITENRLSSRASLTDASVTKSRFSISGAPLGSILDGASEFTKGATNEKWQDQYGDAVETMSSQQKKQLSAIWELIQTERDYARDVYLILDLFVKPLAQAKSVGPKNMPLIFANIEQIFTTSIDLLQNLIAISPLDNLREIADIFMIFVERFMCYIPYSANQSNGSKLLHGLANKTDVKQILEDGRRNPSMKNLDLFSSLVKPIQRICKYPLLLKEILKNTDKDHDDFIYLQRASDKMHSVVGTINECAKRMDGYKLMVDVQARFAEKINIATHNRFLVREDSTQILFSNVKKPRKLFLFNDILILARRDWRDRHHVIEKVALKDIRLSDIMDNNTSNSDVLTSILEIDLVPASEFDSSNRYIISFANVIDKTTWIEAYKSLSKTSVRQKQLKDLSMTSLTNEADDDDNQGQREEPRQVDWKMKLLDMEILLEESQSQAADLEAKLDLKNSILTEKNAFISEIESKLAKLEAECLLQKELNEKNNSEISALNEKLLVSEQDRLCLKTTLSEHCEQVVKLEKELCQSKEAHEVEKTNALAKKLEYEKENANLNFKLQSLNDVLVAKENALQDLKPRYEKSIETVAKLETKISMQSKELQALQTQVGNLLGVNNSLEKNYQEVTAKKNSLDAERTENLNTIKIQSEKIAQLSLQLSKTQTSLSEANSKIQELENEVGASNKAKQNTQNIIQGLRKNVETLQSDLVNEQAKLSKAETDLLAETAKAKIQSTKITALQESFDHMQESHKKEVSEIEKNLKRYVEKVYEKDSIISKKENDIISLHLELEEMKKQKINLESRVEGKTRETGDLGDQISILKAKLIKSDQILEQTNNILLEEKQKNISLDQQFRQSLLKQREKDNIQKDLETKISDMILELSTKNSVLKEKSVQIESLNVQIKEKAEASNQILRKLKDSELEIQDLNHQHKQLLSKFGETDRELNTLKSRHFELESQYQNLFQRFNQKMGQSLDLDREFKEARSKLGDTESLLNSQNQKLLAKELKIAELETHLSSINAQFTQSKSKVQESDALIQDLQKKISSVTNELSKKEFHSNNLAEKLTKTEKKYSEAKQQLKENIEELDLLEKEKYELLKQLQTLENQIHLSANESNLLRSQIKEMKIELDNVKNSNSLKIQNSLQEAKTKEEKWESLLEDANRRNQQEQASFRSELQKAKSIIEEKDVKNRELEDQIRLQNSKLLEYQQINQDLDFKVQRIQELKDETTSALRIQMEQLSNAISFNKTRQKEGDKIFQKIIQESKERLFMLDSVLRERDEAINAYIKELDALGRESNLQRDQIAKLKDKNSEFYLENEKLKEAKLNLEKELMETKIIISESNSGMKQRIEEINKLERVIHSLENQLNIKSTEWNHLKVAETQMYETLENLKLQLGKVDHEKMELKNSNQVMINQLKKLEERNASLEDQISRLQETHSKTIQDDSNTNLKMKLQLDQMYEQLALKSKLLESFEKTESTLKHTLVKREDQIKAFSLEIEKLNQSKSICEKMINTREAQISELEGKITKMEKQNNLAIQMMQQEFDKKMNSELETSKTKFSEEIQKITAELKLQHQNNINEYRNEMLKLEMNRKMLKQTSHLEVAHLSELGMKINLEKETLSSQLHDVTSKYNNLQIEFRSQTEMSSNLKKKLRDIKISYEKAVKDCQTLHEKNQTLDRIHKQSISEAKRWEAMFINLDQKYRNSHQELEQFALKMKNHKDLIEANETLKKVVELKDTEFKQMSSEIKFLQESSRNLSRSVSVTLNSIVEICKLTDTEIDLNTENIKKGRSYVERNHLGPLVCKVGDIKSRNDLLETETIAKQKNITDLIELNRQYEQELAIAASSIEKLQQQHDLLMNNLQNELASTQEKLANSQNMNDTILKKYANIEKEYYALETYKQLLEKDKNQLEIDFMKLYEEFKKQSTQLGTDTQKYTLQINELDQTLRKSVTEISNLKKQIDAHKLIIQQAENEKERLREMISSLSLRNTKCQEQINMMNLQSKDMIKNAEEIGIKLEKADQLNEDLTMKNRDLFDLNQALKTQYNEMVMKSKKQEMDQISTLRTYLDRIKQLENNTFIPQV